MEDPGFLKGVRQPQTRVYQPIGNFFADKCMKMKEIGPRRGTSLAYLESANDVIHYRVFIVNPIVSDLAILSRLGLKN